MSAEAGTTPPDRPRVAIVTGGSRGIGRAAAERLAADGLAVVVTFIGSEVASHDIVDAIRTDGGSAIAVQADVAEETAGRDEATVKRLANASPLERIGTPADIAELVSALAGPARWINGQTVYANDGLA